MSEVGSVAVPILVVGEGNQRGHWRKAHRRKLAQVADVALSLSGHRAPLLPVVVTLVRIAPRDLDTDNLAGAFKAVRDEVARWIGADDRPGSGIDWVYDQERGRVKEYAIRIEWAQVDL